MPFNGMALRSLRKEKKINMDDLAKHLNMGISRSSISLYEREELEPPFEFVETVAKYFNVSLEFLMKDSEVGIGNSNKKITKELTKEITKFEGTSALQVCEVRVQELEVKLEEKEKEIGYLMELRQQDKKLIQMLEKQLESYEKAENKENEANNIRQTG